MKPTSYKIKVCGMQDALNIKELGELGPDYMGLIFYEKSKRFAGATPSMVVDQNLPDTVD